MYSLHLYAFILPVNPIGWLSYSRTNYLFECGECVCVFVKRRNNRKMPMQNKELKIIERQLHDYKKPLSHCKKREFFYESVFEHSRAKMHIFVCTNSVLRLLFGMVQYMEMVHAKHFCWEYVFSRSLFRLLASATNRILYQRWKCFLVETDWTTDRDAVTLVCWKRSIEMSVVMMIVAGCMLPCRRCKNYANVCSVRSKWNFSVNDGSSANVTMGNHANVWNSHANGRIELEWRLKIRQICILHLWWNGFQSLKKEPFNN